MTGTPPSTQAPADVEERARLLSEQDRPEDAVTLAMAHGLLDLAAELLAHGSLSLVRNSGDHERFFQIAQLLGPERIRRWPELEAAAIWILTMNNRLALAKARLDELEARVPELLQQGRSFVLENRRTPFDRPDTRNGMPCWIGMMRAVILSFEGACEPMLQKAAEWRAAFPRAPEYDRATVRCAALHARLMVPRMIDAERDGLAALAIFQEANTEYGIAWAGGGTAFAQIVQGRVSQAESLLDETSRRVASGTKPSTHAAVPLRRARALLLFERGDWAALQTLIANALKLGDPPGSPLLVLLAEVKIKTRILLAMGQAAQALALLEHVRYEGTPDAEAWWLGKIAVERARTAAVAGASDPRLYAGPEAERPLLDLIAGSRRPEPGFARSLRPRIAHAEEQKDADELALLLFLKAKAEATTGQSLPAKRSIHQLLTAGLTRERIGTLAALAPGLQPLFIEVLHGLLRDATSATPDLHRLAALLGQPLVAAVAEETAVSLSKRERQIAMALQEGLSNREIADRLHLTEQTVKWHLWNLFQKLGVRNRGGAARKLSKLGFDLPQAAAPVE